MKNNITGIVLIIFIIGASLSSYSQEKLDIINSFLKSKNLENAEVMIDPDNRFHIVYSKHEMVYDDKDHVFYYILDQNGQILKEQEIAQYLSAPYYYNLGLNKNGNFYLFFLQAERLIFFLFNKQGNIRNNSILIPSAAMYTVCKDSSDSFYIITRAAKRYFITLNSEGIVTENIDISGSVMPPNIFEIKKLTSDKFLCAWTPLDYGQPDRILREKTDMLGYCTFDKNELSFSEQREEKLSEVAEEVLSDSVKLNGFKLSSDNDDLLVIVSDKKDMHNIKTYKVRFNSAGEVIKKMNRKLKRISDIKTVSGKKIILQYEQIKFDLNNSEQILFGLDEGKDCFYLESARKNKY